MYSNNIPYIQESTTILNACTKKSRNLLNAPRILPIDGTIKGTRTLNHNEPGNNGT